MMTQTQIENARKKFFNALSNRIRCQKCKKSQKKDNFGVRLMNKPAVEKGAKPVFLAQSYCNICRH